MDAGACQAEEDAELWGGLSSHTISLLLSGQALGTRHGCCTHCGLGAPQSTHLLFSLVLEMSCSLLRVSGSTSHNLLIVSVCYGMGMFGVGR